MSAKPGLTATQVDDALREIQRLTAINHDLLAVLKAAVDQSDRRHDAGIPRMADVQWLYDRAVAAIARAEGETVAR